MAKKPSKTRRLIERHMRIDMDEARKAETTTELLVVLKKIDELNAQAKDTQAAFRKEIKDKIAERNELRYNLEYGEKQLMEVEEIIDTKKGTITFKDPKTGKTLETRALEEEDYQTELGQEEVEGEDDAEGEDAELL